MKWTVVVAVLVVVGVAAGGSYFYFLHPPGTRVDVRVEPAAAQREPSQSGQVRRDIGTYQDAKHPGFPEQEKRE